MLLVSRHKMAVSLHFYLMIASFTTTINGATKITSLLSKEKSDLETFYVDLTKVQDTENSQQNGAKINFEKTMFIKSFCVRFYFTNMNPQYIFTSGQFRLVLEFESFHGFVLLNGKWLIFSAPKKPPRFSYQHLCFTHNQTHYFVACEGKLWSIIQFYPDHLTHIKKVTNIGELAFGPGSKSTWYFNGKVSELNIFSNTFTEYELLQLTKSCSKANKGIMLFDWSQVQLSDVIIPQELKIKVKVRTNNYFCSKKSTLTVGMFPFPMMAEQANTVCNAWGSKLFFPESSNDLTLMKDRVTNGGKVLKYYTYNKNICKGEVWFPIYKSHGFNKWVELNDKSKEANFKMSFVIKNDGQFIQKCARISDIGSNVVKDTSCFEHMCLFCSWKPYTSFRLRGLCEKSSIEDSYTVTNYFFRDEILRKIIIF